MGMENSPINNVLQHLLLELDRQAHALCQMQDLINQHPLLLPSDQIYYLRKASLEKKRLLDLIKNHNEKLQDFKQDWCNFGVQISVETQEMIQRRIEDIARTAQNILNIEKENVAAPTDPD
ncbi:hypothetical protein MJD09_15930 [bacterium]|nr:hypothetical protein [bacterium]